MAGWSVGDRAMVVVTESSWKPLGTVMSGELAAFRKGVVMGEVVEYAVMRLDIPVTDDGQIFEGLVLAPRHRGGKDLSSSRRDVAVNVYLAHEGETEAPSADRAVCIGLLKSQDGLL